MTNAKKLIQINPSVEFNTLTGSSLIESYAREAGDLALRFKDKRTYIYKNVDDATVAALIGATSKGKFFASNIKGKFVVEQAE